MINKNKFFKNKTILITGGTGSFGKAFTEEILKSRYQIKKLIIFSRDELKQFEMSEYYGGNKKLRFFLGDVRDKDRLKLAFDGIDIIIHAAALKQVPTAEYNPFEFVKTNILGAQNIIESALEFKIPNILALSTDKASSPVNLYGATKLCSDKLFVSAQNLVGKNKKCKFSVVRYGNVMNSRGSIIPKFLKNNLNYFPVTNKQMTRFNITLIESVNFVLESLVDQRGGEIFIPILPSYKILDLCKAIDDKKKIKIIGIRPGEKIHEELCSSSESINTIILKKKYIILPPVQNNVAQTYDRKKFKFVKPYFSYNSGLNKNFLSLNQLKRLIFNKIQK